MDAKVLFSKCLAQANAVMTQVKDSQFNYPTPDTEWNVRDLIGHILYELSWVPDVLDGRTVAEVGNKYDGDLIGDDLQASWSQALNLAKEAVNKVDLTKTIHLSYGDFSAEHYIRDESNDQFIHAWDLASAIDVPIRFDEVVAQVLYDRALPRKQHRADSGLFAPAIDVPESTDIQTKILALFGRQNPWPKP